MALINCPECKKEISNQSASCIYCGCPIQSQKFDPLSSPFPPQNYEPKKNESDIISVLAKIIVVVIGSALVYQCVSPDNSSGSSNSSSNEVTKGSSVEIETTASQMINTYENNEVRADAIYKDRVIKITGIVASISSDISDKAVVSLAPNGDEYAIMSVHASGDNNFHNQAIELKKGQKVTFVCIGGGEIIGSPILNKCHFS